jgi:hypothetical protein
MRFSTILSGLALATFAAALTVDSPVSPLATVIKLTFAADFESMRDRPLFLGEHHRSLLSLCAFQR